MNTSESIMRVRKFNLPRIQKHSILFMAKNAYIHIQFPWISLTETNRKWIKELYPNNTFSYSPKIMYIFNFFSLTYAMGEWIKKVQYFWRSFWYHLSSRTHFISGYLPYGKYNTGAPKNICTKTVSESIFLIDCKQSKYSSKRNWLNKLGHDHVI